MATSMNIKDLLKIKSWTPIQQIKLNFDEIAPGLLRITEAENLYALVIDHNEKAQKNGSGPFITAILWADSVQGALHCTLNGKNDKVNRLAHPPAEFLLAPGSVKYGEILDVAREGSFGKYMESADYKLPENYFVQRVITVGRRYAFYFRSKKDDLKESVYAIKYELED